MALLWKAVLVATGAIFFKISFPQFFTHRMPENFDGSTTKQFKHVESTFRQLFKNGWETHGAAFAVYKDGKLVVDIWGGYADDYALRKWKKDTLTVVFSATKSLAALSIAKLVDQGHLKYEDLVSKHWPEFKQNGKENITVKILSSHQAGLSYTDVEASYADAADWKRMGKLLAAQKPHWPAGTRFGYHSLTYGWLMDQLVRRADPRHRSIGTFIQEELIKPTGTEEMYLGLPIEHQHRVSRLKDAGLLDDIAHVLSHWGFFKMVFPYFTGTWTELTKRSFNEPTWLLEPIHQGRNPFNNPDIHRLEIAASNGIGTARGLAQPFAALSQGKLLSEATIRQLATPMWIEEQDIVLGVYTCGGRGFAYTRSQKNDTWLMGHPGHGGQNVKVDMKNGLAFAYVTNSLKLGAGEVTRTFNALQKSVYDSL